MSKAIPPVKALGGPDEAAQMQQFVKNENMNIFRLSVRWQYLVYNKLEEHSIGTLRNTTDLFKHVWLLAQAASSTYTTMLAGMGNYWSRI